MSSTTKNPIIDPESKRLADEELTTPDLYREVDSQIRALRNEDKWKKRVLVKQAVNDGDELFEEIEDKRKLREEKKIKLVEHIYKKSKEKYVTLKKAKTLSYEEIKLIYNQVVENEKPLWRKIINVFR